VFPLGGEVKDTVRQEADERGLATATKPDSHDICFIPDGDTAGFLARTIGRAPGPIVEASTGEQVGEHDGTHGFTIGQRRGLRIGRPAADGRPRYVLDVEPATRTVLVGPAEALDTAGVTTGAPVWCGPDPGPQFRAQAQYRAHGAVVPCQVQVTRGAHDVSASVLFEQPQRGVAPGQTIAFYAEDRVIGSATIDAPLPVA
jgi:tRNA-specific 2-thiouridylase